MTAPIVPARLDFEADGVPCVPESGDVHPPAAGALAQAQHVFLGGNGLPSRWQGRERFTVLEAGFGLGHNFLATWRAWRDDPRRPRRLHFVSIEKHPLRREDLARAHEGSAVPELAARLVAQWPALTPNLHELSFDDGRVRLLLAFGDVAALLPELVVQADAFYLDGFAPTENPQTSAAPVLKSLGRLAAPGATAATPSAASALREGLAAAGFEVETQPGFADKREMTVARFAPRFTPPLPWLPSGVPAAGAAPGSEVVIVGGGLAGCAAAHALSRQGLRCTVLDRRDAPAQETSGNAGGLFHGIVNAHDGAHARFHRAAALHAERLLRELRARHPIAGGFDGLLRLDTEPADAMQRTLDALGLPPDYVRALGPGEASALAGLPLASSAWFYPGGGWLRPGDYARALLAEGGEAVRWRGSVEVDALREGADGWELLDAQGGLLARAPRVVLANAHDAARLLQPKHWPVGIVRGQTTRLPADTPGLRAPLRALAGAGYLLPAHEGEVLCGATSQSRDRDPSVREADHAHNLAQLARLSGATVAPSPEVLRGRVGWRSVADDRLPVIGPVPDEVALASVARLEQPRFVPRRPGLFVYTALASRGITWAALGAEVLASWVAASPCPIELSLRNALDPARFVSRAVRHAQRPGRAAAPG
ncbi:bifunctional tRNA (5-methylaminomethyl-2-thiouridine)(34)-methyltransferase MnmD/FAD-dependent 5-carboxymethylaminomethyl-2-thiouridine(34) oxidoreductase MnmC [Caldimonas tepidiphila]|uniref:bifunctional tRNA (5-methylaminomethyl-2-thiouridine)(34)-methyltransferase MnmD/FAD-dependent 5-carboxymethylaminomethyl-2-thiouridine(34) oxidoreductase MnmC n=1 Tax=Caldimonas tepidiphila TaxID=2315841 RepID=UPI000E5BF927|nr:bifunctional tRNA (5-methylaminomethyl-2-thiouridine)(34)-methyltransferase MnmD/FAD-dependent 5-carboxymethylaminomethyl-2-thiouridine(34) oxidoreductase MnmC [Caldimonas tepidiphila]